MTRCLLSPHEASARLLSRGVADAEDGSTHVWLSLIPLPRLRLRLERTCRGHLGQRGEVYDVTFSSAAESAVSSAIRVSGAWSFEPLGRVSSVKLSASVLHPRWLPSSLARWALRRAVTRALRDCF